MPRAKTAGRVAVWGRSGSGKSWHVRNRLLRGRNRVVVFDPLGEFGGRGWTRAADLRALVAALKGGWARGFRVAYTPRAGQEAADLHRLSLVLLQAQQPYAHGRDGREITLVVEEMNLSFPVTALRADLYGFGEICSRGRHYGIHVIGVSQRPAEVNARFRGNATETYIFPLKAAVDQRAILQEIGQEWRQTLRELPERKFLHIDRSGKIRRGPM